MSLRSTYEAHAIQGGSGAKTQCRTHSQMATGGQEASARLIENSACEGYPWRFRMPQPPTMAAPQFDRMSLRHFADFLNKV